MSYLIFEALQIHVLAAFLFEADPVSPFPFQHFVQLSILFLNYVELKDANFS